jgi:hypothetical protein
MLYLPAYLLDPNDKRLTFEYGWWGQPKGRSTDPTYGAYSEPITAGLNFFPRGPREMIPAITSRF